MRVCMQKLFCTCVSALIPDRGLRHRVRYALHPLNDRRCLEYFDRRYVERVVPSGFSIERKAPLPSGVEYIWQCWLQGTENMPPLVRECLHSVVAHKRPGQEVILITEQNYDSYVTLPDFIVRKRRDGRIGDAQFSDLLRIWLLASYGGYWIDATCLMTSEIPPRISNAGFFIFHSYGEFAYTLIQSCFIRADAESYLLQRWKQLMAELWRTEDSLLHYFQLHIMFKAMVRADWRARTEYLRMEAVTDKAMHILHGYMKENVPFSRESLDRAEKESFIHKLTYKLKPCDDGGVFTFRDYLWGVPEP